jgi:hypothetical protein
MSIKDYGCCWVMKNLNGLWKDESQGLLVQLHGVEVSGVSNTMRGDLATLGATARVVKGDGKLLLRCPFMLTALLPKQTVKIRVVDAYQYTGSELSIDLGFSHIIWKSGLWKIEGVAVCEGHDFYSVVLGVPYKGWRMPGGGAIKHTSRHVFKLAAKR